MTGLAEAIHLGNGLLQSAQSAMSAGGDTIVIVECVEGEDPDETDPEDDEP